MPRRVTMDFSPSGQLGNFWDANGTGLALYYNTDGTTRQIVDAAGRKVDYTYVPGTSRVSKVTQSGDNSETRSISYGYDASGRLSSSTDANGATTTYSYGGNGKLSTVTTSRGVKLTIEYDSSGRASSVSRWDDAGKENRTGFNYGSSTQTVVTDPNGGTWIYAMDSQKRQTGTKDPYRNSRSKTYTANNAVATSTAAVAAGGVGADVTSFSWDTNNNPSQVKMPTGATTTLGYGSAANCGTDAGSSGDKLKCVTDPAGNKTAMNWDAQGNLTSSTSGDGTAGAATSTITYQKGGNLLTGDSCGGKPGQICSVTQPKVAGQNSGWKVTNAYDTHGNLISSTGSDTALLGARKYTYDGFGRVKTVTDGKGATLTYTWDNRDHVTAVSGAASLSLAHDSDGNLTNNAGATLTYDKQNRATSLTVAGESTRVTYEASGNVSTYTDDTGATTTYRYFWHNRVSSISVDGTDCQWDRSVGNLSPSAGVSGKAGCVRFAYDAGGRETQRAYPGGAIQYRGYDGSGRVVGISANSGVGARITSQAYNYLAGAKDQVNVQSWSTGAVPSLAPGPAAGASQSYLYDSLNRLIKVSESSGAVWGYAYDPMGNRTSMTRAGTATMGVSESDTATYNAASMLVSNSKGSFAYDKNGNEVSAPAGPGGSGIPARTNEVTDALGNTTAMMVAGSGVNFSYGSTTPGMYNQLLGAGSSTYGRSILGLALSSRNMGGVATRYVAHPSGQNIGYVAPQGQAWFLTDKLGSVIGLVDSKGALIGSYSYDPTGVNRANTATGALAARNIHRYAGGLFEPATGLTRFGVRWYNPVTGRFTTPDPSGKEKNNYLYAGGNSCNRVDPTGESWDDLGNLLLAGVAGVAGVAGGVIGGAVGVLGGEIGVSIGVTVGGGCAFNTVLGARTGSQNPGFDCVAGAAGGLALLAMPKMFGPVLSSE
ncbi:hypothetical protein KEM60_00004 [Austwickia sp. TVS 96-490-7B]|nr:hypothetical protein [Austwickia sp. TVS 96-490-7B]